MRGSFSMSGTCGDLMRCSFSANTSLRSWLPSCSSITAALWVSHALSLARHRVSKAKAIYVRMYVCIYVNMYGWMDVCMYAFASHLSLQKHKAYKHYNGTTAHGVSLVVNNGTSVGIHAMRKGGCMCVWR